MLAPSLPLAKLFAFARNAATITGKVMADAETAAMPGALPAEWRFARVWRSTFKITASSLRESVTLISDKCRVAQ